jgi:hypothetical protein
MSKSHPENIEKVEEQNNANTEKLQKHVKKFRSLMKRNTYIVSLLIAIVGVLVSIIVWLLFNQ